MSGVLLPDDLHQHPFATLAVEFPVEDLFPGAEVHLALCNRHHHLTAHDSPLQVGIGIVLIAVVTVLTVWFLRGQFLQPYFEIVVQARFIVVDKDGCRYMHRINEDETFLYAAFHKACVDIRGDVDQFSSFGDVEPEFLSV